MPDMQPAACEWHASDHTRLTLYFLMHSWLGSASILTTLSALPYSCAGARGGGEVRSAVRHARARARGRQRQARQTTYTDGSDPTRSTSAHLFCPGHHGVHELAWAAPGGPKVDQHGHGGLQQRRGAQGGWSGWSTAPPGDHASSSRAAAAAWEATNDAPRVQTRWADGAGGQVGAPACHAAELSGGGADRQPAQVQPLCCTGRTHLEHLRFKGTIGHIQHSAHGDRSTAARSRAAAAQRGPQLCRRARPCDRRRRRRRPARRAAAGGRKGAGGRLDGSHGWCEGSGGAGTPSSGLTRVGAQPSAECSACESGAMQERPLEDSKHW